MKKYIIKLLIIAIIATLFSGMTVTTLAAGINEEPPSSLTLMTSSPSTNHSIKFDYFGAAEGETAIYKINNDEAIAAGFTVSKSSEILSAGYNQGIVDIVIPAGLAAGVYNVQVRTGTKIGETENNNALHHFTLTVLQTIKIELVSQELQSDGTVKVTVSVVATPPVTIDEQFVTTPDSTKITSSGIGSNQYTFIATKNGSYRYTVIDNYGNTEYLDINVTLIPVSPPIPPLPANSIIVHDFPSSLSWIKNQVAQFEPQLAMASWEIRYTFQETSSSYPSSEITLPKNSNNKAYLNINKNGIYTFKLYDTSVNPAKLVCETTRTAVNIDTSAPTLELSKKLGFSYNSITKEQWEANPVLYSAYLSALSNNDTEMMNKIIAAMYGSDINSNSRLYPTLNYITTDANSLSKITVNTALGNVLHSRDLTHITANSKGIYETEGFFNISSPGTYTVTVEDIAGNKISKQITFYEWDFLNSGNWQNTTPIIAFDGSFKPIIEKFTDIEFILRTPDVIPSGLFGSTENLRYQWQIKNSSGNFVNIPGATSATYRSDSPKTTEEYRIKVYDKNNNWIISESVSLDPKNAAVTAPPEKDKEDIAEELIVTGILSDMNIGDAFVTVPNHLGGKWVYDSSFFDGDSSAISVFTAKKDGATTLVYTVTTPRGTVLSKSFTVTINANAVNPPTSDDQIATENYINVYVATAIVILLTGAVILIGTKKVSVK